MKIVTESIHTINDHDFDTAASKFMKARPELAKFLEKGVRYSSVAVNEWSNDSSHRFRVRAKKYVVDAERKYAPRAGEILNWLCCEGEIPEGEYCIKVCW